jgi:hypothetical protein
MGGTGMGEKPNPYAAPPLEPRPMGWGGPGMRHWALVKLPERSIYYAFLLNSDGTFSASGTGAKGGGEINSRVDYAYESEKPGWAYSGVSVQEHEWVDGFPRLHRGAISLTRPDDGIDRFQIEVVSKPIYMQGGGYWGGWNDGLGRGVFRGESLVEGEVWDVSHPTRVYDLDGREIPQKPGGSYAEVFARYTNLDDPDEVGLGMLEAVIMGEYGGIKA